MKTGLVSVTFRQFDVEHIINLVKSAGLDGIEWGADIHAKPDNIENAKKIAKMMQESGLETISYGSYYRVGESDNFDDVLKTAVALDTKNIRVWAGNMNSENAEKAYRQKIVDDVKRIATLANEKNITISFEYHGETLTNTQASTVQLLNEINMDNVFAYWQPLANTNCQQNISNIQELSKLNKLMNIHAYNWVGKDVFMLEQAKDKWSEYIKNAVCNAVMLEFVKDASVDNFMKDAKTLKELV